MHDDSRVRVARWTPGDETDGAGRREARNPWRYVLAGGLVAGTFDIVYACTFWGLKSGAAPRRVFQSVAAGLLGRASFQGGAATATLGLALHFFIACSMAVVYFVVARRWALLRERPVTSGAAYGALLYVIMNYLVVPLSAASKPPRDPVWITSSITVHVLLIGIPCALGTYYAFSPRRAPTVR